MYGPPQADNQHPLQQLLAYGFRVGRLFGIEIRVHFLLVLMLIITLLYDVFRAYNSTYGPLFGLLLSVATALVLYGSILAHELGHCYGTYLVGGISRSILLWPLGGLASGEGTNRTPRTELVVIALGPATSLLLGCLGWVILQVIPAASAGSSLAYQFVYYCVHRFMWINFALFLFNMLMPILPLDCAALLRAGFSLKYSPERVTYILCNIGMGVAGVVFAISLLAPNDLPFARTAGPILALIAVFGFFQCWQTLQLLPHMQIYMTEPWGYSYQPTITSPLVSPEWKAGVMQSWGQWLPRRRPRPSRNAPPDKPAVVVPLNKVDRLRQEMEQAAASEDFERAAELRDRLRRLSEEGEE